MVAPIERNSPRASAGFRRFDASIDPSLAPAPTSVCSSSMNKITPPSLFCTASITAFSRSSNSPRNFAPATNAPRSRESKRFPLRLSGTSPETIRRASPSTIAVFPTPGSPISTGLFFVRRESTCITRRISSSRPITGSIFSSRARVVRSRQYFSKHWNVDSGSWLVTRLLPRISLRAALIVLLVMP